MHQVRFPIAFLIVAGITTARAEEPSSNDYRRVNDIQYAEVDGHRLLLDL
jgi:hypothetical protein